MELRKGGSDSIFFRQEKKKHAKAASTESPCQYISLRSMSAPIAHHCLLIISEEKKKMKWRGATFVAFTSFRQNTFDSVNVRHLGTAPDFPCENENSSISGREALSNSIITSELVATSTSQSKTYNPAQDMLDMFLGPLLRKTIEKEETSKSIMENVKITHELTRKSQDEPNGGEIVPLMKKRNTLKDKVTM
ncbi:hypothetical protein RJT34_13904 [Clitoria ternatea]|uniref:Uncharacterized protein n=1 Tax=Clitoria ternatea TaxID=43366 RepID=A0AAN9PKL4_CLITE